MKTLWVGLVVLAACHDNPPKTVDAPMGVVDAAPDANPALTEVALIPVVANRDVDLLFMVDNSPSTLDKQTNLKNAFPAFVTTLTALTGGLPNVHIGVVTSDLGTKGSLDSQPGPAIGSGPGSCTGIGQAGNLQTNGTTQITGNYISDTANTDGSRTTNYTGTLASAFSAIASVGAAGCGFEQPIEATKLALDNNAANAGFLRPAANLGIIYMTDEDDCSIAHSTLFGPDTTTFGPLNSFRCTRFGVTCDQGGTTTDEMNMVGTKGACHSNDTSPYLTHVADYVTFFKGLKADPRNVLVAAIAADPTPVAVELRPPPGGGTAIPALTHSCMYTDAQNQTEVGDPAVRLNQLVAGFDRHQFASVCSADLTVPMTELAHQIGPMIGIPCLAEPIAQPPVCQVFDERPGMADVEIPQCGGGTMPCYTLTADATACPDGQHMNIMVSRSTTPPADTMVSVRCAL